MNALPDSQSNPYVGPRPFETGEPLYGRDKDILKLYHLLLSERIVLLYSPSGAGKSSLVEAGLIPKLRGEFNVLPRIRVNQEPPEELAANEGFNRYAFSAILSLEETRQGDDRTPPEALASLTLADYLSQRPAREAAPPADGQAGEEEGEQTYEILVFDQFEEILTTAPNDLEGRRLFFDQVGEVLRDKRRWALFVAREDFVAAFDPYLRSIPTRLTNRYRLDFLDADLALEAIQKPAQDQRANFGDTAARKLVDDLREVQVQRPDGTMATEKGPYVEPVQLQVVCRRLWEKLSAKDQVIHEITEQDITSSGEVNESLAAYYSDQVCGAEEKFAVPQRIIREWFGKGLINSQGRRIQVMLEPETSGGLDNRVIDFMDKAHLVRGEKRRGATWFELTHDRLVGPILEDNQKWFAEYLSPLQRRAALWVEQGKDESLLFTGLGLLVFEEWAKAHPEEMSDVEKQYLKACRAKHKQAQEDRDRQVQQQKAEEQARSVRRAYWFIAASLFLVAIAAIASFIASKQTDEAKSAQIAAEGARATAQANAIIAENQAGIAEFQARIAESAKLSIQALGQLDTRPDLAMLLSIEAYRTNENPQSQSTVLTTLEETASIRNFINLNQVTDTQLSPDGETIAALDQEGVTLWGLDGHKLGGPFAGHPSPIYSIAFSPDGKILAASSKDGSIILWDENSGQRLAQPLTYHTDWVNAVAFSPDGKTLASASDDQTVILWDLTNPRNPQEIGAPIGGYDNCVASAVFSPDGKTLATSQCFIGTIILWNIQNPEDPQPVSTFGSQTDGIYTLAFSEDGRILASGSKDGTTVLWDMSNPDDPQPLGETEALDSAVYSVAISPDGKTLASGQSDGSIVIWDMSSPREPQQEGNALHEHGDIVNSVSFSPDGSVLASGSFDGKIILWDVANQNILSQLSGGGASAINSVRFSPSGSTLAAGVENGSIVLWDVSEREKPLKIGNSLQGHSNLPDRMEFSAQGNFLTLFNDAPTEFSSSISSVIVDTINHTLIGTGQVEFEDPQGKFLVSQVYDEDTDTYQIRLSDSTTGAVLRKPIPGVFLAIHPDKQIIVYKTIDQTNRAFINLWDLSAERQIGRPVQGDYLALSADGEILAYSESSNPDRSAIRLEDIETGALIGTAIEGEFIGIDPSSKNLLYDTVNNQGQPVIIIWDITNERIVGKPILGTSLELSPDGRTLVFRTSDAKGGGQINLLDTSAGVPIGKPIAGDLLSFSPSSKTLLYWTSDSADNTLYHLLDTATGSSIPGFSATGYVPDQAFSPDGNYLSYQTYNSNDNSYYFTFWDIAANQQIGNPIKGDTIIDTHQQGNTLVYQIDDGSGGQKMIVIDTASHRQIGEMTRAEFKALIQDGEVLLYQDESGLKQFDTIDGTTTTKSIKGDLLSVGPDGKTLLVQNGGAIEIRDTFQATTPGVAVVKGEIQGNSQTAALSPDGKTLALFDSGDILLHDTESGALRGKPFNYHRGGLTISGDSATFSPDGKTLAAGDYGANTLTLLDVSTQRQIGDEIPGSYVAFSPDGKTMAVGNYFANTVTLWDVATHYQIGNELPGDSAAFSPDGKTLAAGDYNASAVTLWDLSTQERIGNELPGYYPAFSPDGKTLATGDYTASAVTLWDVSTQKRIGNDMPGSYAAFSPDGKTLAVGDYNKSTVTLWDANTQERIGNDMPGSYASFSPDGRTLAVGDYNTSTVKLWDVGTQTQVGNELTGDFPAFSLDGKTLATGNYSTSAVTLWDVNAQNRAASRRLATSKGDVTSLTFSPDGKALASIGDDGVVLSDVSTQAKLAGPIPGRALVFSPEGNVAAVSDGYNTTSLWDATTGGQLGGPISGVDPVFSPGGLVIATKNNSDTTITLWKLDTLGKLNTKPLYGDDILFSLDGTMAAVINWRDTVQSDQGGEGTPTPTPEAPRKLGVTLWALTSTSVKPVSDLSLSCPPDQIECKFSAAFSQDGRTLAYSNGKEIYLWDTAKREQIDKSLTSVSGVTNLAFIRDGQFLVAEDLTGFTSIWNLPSLASFGEPIQGSLRLGDNYSDSNTFLISKGADLYLWKFDPNDWISRLCSKVGRNFTRAEWIQFGLSEPYPAKPEAAACPQWSVEPEPTPSP